MSLDALELTCASVTYRGLVCQTDKGDWPGSEATKMMCQKEGVSEANIYTRGPSVASGLELLVEEPA